MKALLGLGLLALLSCESRTPQADAPAPWPAHVAAEYPGPCLTEEWIGSKEHGMRLIATMRWGYDAAGRVTLYEQLSGDNPWIISREETSFDADERPAIVDTIYGRLDEYAPQHWTRSRYTYNAQGLLVHVGSDRGRDGSINAELSQQWNPQGLMTERRQTNDHPYTSSTWRRWTYDGDGNVVHAVGEESWPARSDQPARIERRVSESDWANGRLIERRVDVGDDGRIDQHARYAYDPDGRQTLAWRDEDGDGVPEHYVVTRFSDDGLTVTEDRDTDSDGALDWRDIEITSPDGATVERRQDAGMNGIIEHVTHIETTATGRITRYDSDADGRIDSLHVVEWEPSQPERVTRDSHDDDADGNPEALRLTRYGPYGAVEQRRYEDGVLVDRWTSTYDAYGNPLDSVSGYSVFRTRYVCPWSRFERREKKAPRSRAAPPPVTSDRLDPLN